jgi:hypothetical protein
LSYKKFLDFVFGILLMIGLEIYVFIIIGRYILLSDVHRHLMSIYLPQYLSLCGGEEISLMEHGDNVPILLNWENN